MRNENNQSQTNEDEAVSAMETSGLHVQVLTEEADAAMAGWLNGERDEQRKAAD